MLQSTRTLIAPKGATHNPNHDLKREQIPSSKKAPKSETFSFVGLD
jgi:hypothetical protein